MHIHTHTRSMSFKCLSCMLHLYRNPSAPIDNACYQCEKELRMLSRRLPTPSYTLQESALIQCIRHGNRVYMQLFRNPEDFHHLSHVIRQFNRQLWVKIIDEVNAAKLEMDKVYKAEGWSNIRWRHTVEDLKFRIVSKHIGKQ